MTEIEKLTELNQKYGLNEGLGGGSETFVFADRGSKLILSAPHAVKTFLNGKIKGADLFTGALAEYLGEKCQVSTLNRMAYFEEEYLIDEYVIESGLAEHFFIDLHGMTDHEDFDLAVGTGLLEVDAYKQALDEISRLCEEHRLRMVLNHPHYAGIAGMKAFTARMQMQTRKPQVLQLEWGYSYRDFFKAPEKVRDKMIPFMEELLRTLESRF